MRIPTPALLLLVASACSHTQAPPPTQTPPPPAEAAAPAAATATELPHMEPPASPLPGWQLARRGDALLREGKNAEGLALYQQALDAGNTDPNVAYSAACAQALLGRKEEALRLLELAAERGYRDVKWMKQDEDLASLRGEPAFTALVERMPSLPERFPGSNPELQRLFAEDQADRSPPPPDKEGWKRVSERDAQRRQRVTELLSQGALKTGADYLAAGFIFQHGGTQKDYAQAREMGAEAAKRGHPGGLWLAAAAWDRWLMHAGKPQRFGTQYRFDAETKKPRLHEVDPSVTDGERARWGFPPLAEIPTSM